MGGWRPSGYFLGLKHLILRNLLLQDRVKLLGAGRQLLRKLWLVELGQVLLLLLLVIMIISFIGTMVGGVMLSLLLIRADWVPLRLFL